MKKILVVDDSPRVREYLKRKLEEYEFEVETAVSGLDGAAKMRQIQPDLIVTDLHLSRKSGIDLLREKHADPNLARVPAIVASGKVDRAMLVELAGIGVKRFLTKPIKIDALLKAVSEVLGVKVALDTTPCVIEAHVNEGIVFVEVAQGLNREKIDLLRYKLEELLDLYEIRTAKILLLMTSVDLDTADSIKLSALFETIVESSGAMRKHIKVLTRSTYVRDFIAQREDFAGIQVTDSLEKAMDGLMTQKMVGGSILENQSDVREDITRASAPRKERGDEIHMRFHDENRTHFDLAQLGDSVRIVIVDDDVIIQELIRSSFADTKVRVDAYGNGRLFVDSEDGMQADLVFLDLMMPEMDGFQVLERMRTQPERPPVIVLSALSKRETVAQALKLGVTSYMVKPLKGQEVRTKATEVLQLNF